MGMPWFESVADSRPHVRQSRGVALQGVLIGSAPSPGEREDPYVVVVSRERM
jgi:hypothetical protein